MSEEKTCQGTNIIRSLEQARICNRRQLVRLYGTCQDGVVYIAQQVYSERNVSVFFFFNCLS